MEEDFYKLDELIGILEDIKEKKSGDINFCKALYCLAKEIEWINICFESINKSHD